MTNTSYRAPFGSEPLPLAATAAGAVGTLEAAAHADHRHPLPPIVRVATNVLVDPTLPSGVIYWVDTTANDRDVNLPPLATVGAGWQVTIVNVGAEGFTTTVNADAGDDTALAVAGGAASLFPLLQLGNNVTLQADPTDGFWLIVAYYGP